MVVFMDKALYLLIKDNWDYRLDNHNGYATFQKYVFQLPTALNKETNNVFWV